MEITVMTKFILRFLEIGSTRCHSGLLGEAGDGETGGKGRARPRF